jgi:UDP-2,3-diacylglucosamine pyrophosphatase LpxH
MRTIAIGDIHGGYKALVQLIDKINLKDDDLLIFLGDYVDGWSESYEVVDYLISLSRKRKQNHQTAPIYLRGNHDDLVVENLKAEKPHPMWLKHGGQSTLESYKNRTEEEIEVHFDFLKNHLFNFHERKGNGFFHAGFHNLNGPHYEYFENITYWDRTLWEMALALEIIQRDFYRPYPYASLGSIQTYACSKCMEPRYRSGLQRIFNGYVCRDKRNMAKRSCTYFLYRREWQELIAVLVLKCDYNASSTREIYF